MERLNVWAERLEGFVHAGCFSFGPEGQERFEYVQDYLAASEAVPLYPILPLRPGAFDAQVFNYLAGNCDNHLKNLSMTWDAEWKSKTVSPVYDITCTTVYPDLSRNLGLGIGRHRAIDAAALAQRLVGDAQARLAVVQKAAAL